MSRRKSCLGTTIIPSSSLTISYRTARGSKVELLRELHADNPLVEVIDIPDIINGHFQDAFVGVDAVIHTASPLPGRADPDHMMKVRDIFETC